MKLVSEIFNKKVLVVLGPGGVGKTTTSSLLAIKAASEGKKVALVSVDPARRLSSVLNIPVDGSLTKVDFSENIVKGELFVSMLDGGAILSRFIKRFVTSPDNQKKIFENQAYQVLIDKFAGSTEYLAVLKLIEILEGDAYDLVVVDTPPHIHAIDFLLKPKIISSFVDNKVFKALIKPFYFLAKSTKSISIQMQLMSRLEKYVGGALLRSIVEFLYLSQEMIEGVHNASQSSLGILKTDQTGYVGIFTANESSSGLIDTIHAKLDALELKLDLLILNKVLPQEVSDEIASLTKGFSENAILDKQVDLLKSRVAATRDLVKLLETKHIPSHQVFENQGDMSSLGSLVRFAQDAFASPAK